MEFTAPIFETDKPTKLGRIYPYEVFKAAIDKLQNSIDSETLIGELGPALQLEIDVENASHVMTKIFNDGDQWFGTATTLSNRNGQILNKVLEKTHDVKFAPRGTGIVDENGVVSDYEIVTFDLVINPPGDLN